ncbi:AA3R protein, partial [Erithacus rubecula]|nr:AA3R protein [Erithacus rubecula]
RGSPGAAGMPNGSLAPGSAALGSLHGLYIGTECLVAVLATLGNALVMCAVRLRAPHNPALLLVGSLALADAAVGLLVMPLAVVVSLGMAMPAYSCLFLCCLLLVFTNASILSLLAIAIDRYLRVKLPTRYKTISTERRVWGALGLCWGLSLLAGLLPMFGWNQAGPSSSSPLRCSFTAVVSMDFMVYFCFLTWTLLPLLVMCALYAEIFCIIHARLSQGTGGRGAGAFYGQELKAAKSLALVLFLFAVSWLPLCIINCVSYFHPDSQIPPYLIYLAILLSHANSAMNPIIYAYRIKKFRTTYLLILRTYILCKKPEPAL